MKPTPPCDLNTLREVIAARHPTLSGRLQQIARFALEHPSDMALRTIAVIAGQIGVPPSAMIRFAQAFGYRGFSDMQAVFRARLGDSSASYEERLRLLREKLSGTARPAAADVLREFAAANIASLERLAREVPPARLEQAVDLLAAGRGIHIIGQRRSFPVAAYLAYALSHLGRHARLLDGVGGMLFEQTSGLFGEDVLIAVSFPPYAPETAEVVARTAGKGVAVIVITDSPLSPIAGPATVCLEVHDAEVRTFRSLAATLCLAQTLAMSLGLRLEDERRVKEAAQIEAD